MTNTSLLKTVPPVYTASKLFFTSLNFFQNEIKKQLSDTSCMKHAASYGCRVIHMLLNDVKKKTSVPENNTSL